MYSISKNDAGELIITRDKDDHRIREDYGDQDYCDFLTYRSQSHKEAHPDFVFRGNGVFFAAETRLYDYCKRNGIMLWQWRGGIKDRPRLYTSPGYTPARQRAAGEMLSEVHVASVIPSSDQPEIDGITCAPSGSSSGIFVSLALSQLLDTKMSDEDSTVRRLSSTPLTRSFVYLDVSDFSKFPSGRQALVINSIVRIFQMDELWNNTALHLARESFEAMICIGDGYIFVFKNPAKAALFAAAMAFLIERLAARNMTEIVPVEFHFRIGIHVGPVYCFWDPGRGDWNYIGDGINGGQRVLAAGGKEKDDVIYVSGELRQALAGHKSQEFPVQDLLKSLHNRGRVPDKHGKPWRLYELNHTDLLSRFYGPYNID